MHALKKVQVIYNCLPLIYLRDKQLHFHRFILSNSSSRRHLIVQLLLHSVKEVSTTVVLTSPDIGIKTVAVLSLDTKELVHGLSQFLEFHFAVIHTSHHADAIYHLYEVYCVPRPAYRQSLTRLLMGNSYRSPLTRTCLYLQHHLTDERQGFLDIQSKNTSRIWM